MDLYRFHPGRTRLLVSIPHAGTFVPGDIATGMTVQARSLPDTDWHVDRLYDFLAEAGATVLVATHSRYVVDLNRASDGALLYPGLTETGVCPELTFDGQPIWTPREAPDAAEIARRLATYWQPYHQRLRRELDALRAAHGSAVLWDAHSIRSSVPRLFPGELPVLNLGTDDGRSCGAALAGALWQRARSAPAWSAVLNGRFKGGYITRAYGDPQRDIHAVQLEIAQRAYMDEASGEYLVGRAAPLRALLGELIGIVTGQ